MRFLSVFIFLSLCFVWAAEADAQDKTIVLVRHAEKDVSSAADPNDPVLSAEGIERAGRLAKRIKGYRVGAIYSSTYRRTRETAEAVAKQRRLELKSYDPKDQQALISEMMNSKTKRFLVVGHSNTIPPLANMLVKKELFKNLEEAEFGVIWVIKLRKGRSPTVKILTY